jgi:endonuclease I
MKITVGTIPAAFSNVNNNVEVRINDNDNLVQAWGNPKIPTFGLTSSTAPVGYYASLEGKSGVVLKQAIQDIIANPAVVRKYTYGDVYDILKECDQNPNNSSQVWLMYVEQPRSKLDLQTGTSGAIGFWNREHIYPQSRGGFSDATSSTPGGINNWLPTSASDIAAGHSDAHHIRAEDSPENSVRSNRNYGIDYNGPLGSQGSWRGDVARSLFYMAVRYNILNVVNGNPPENPDGFIGDLASLLQWNTLDRSDDFEMNRNNIIFNWQKNRNPFIDHPNLANYIWGANTGQTWFSTLSTIDNSELKMAIYPNPAKNSVTISGLNNNSTIEICSLSGQVLLRKEFVGETKIDFNLPAGVYISKITSDGKLAVKKLIVK